MGDWRSTKEEVVSPRLHISSISQRTEPKADILPSTTHQQPDLSIDYAFGVVNMKLSFFSFVALSSVFFSSVIAVPTTDVEKRQLGSIVDPVVGPAVDTAVVDPAVINAVLPIVQTLFTAVQTSTAIISM